MKILLTELGNAVNAQGGIEKVVCNMANAFTERGHEVAIMVFDKREGGMAFPLDSRVKFLNPGVGAHISRTWVNITNIFRKGKWNKEVAQHRHLTSKMAKVIAPVINEFNPNIIIGHDLKSAIIFNDYITNRAPYISLFHFSPEITLENPNFRSCFNNVNGIVVLLPSFVQRVQNMTHNNNVFVIPNIVPQYDEVADYSAKTIINVARIERKSKRQMDIVEAFNKLQKDFPDWHVEFWGDTNFDKTYFAELQQKIQEYGLQEKIIFGGKTDKVSEKLKQASIFAFPSEYEGFPLAMTEAMSMGLPAVGYKTCSAVNEIIKDGENGYLCDFTVEALTEKLHQLMQDEDLRRKLGTQAKKDMQQYAGDKIWDEWEKLGRKFV